MIFAWSSVTFTDVLCDSSINIYPFSKSADKSDLLFGCFDYNAFISAIELPRIPACYPKSTAIINNKKLTRKRSLCKFAIAKNTHYCSYAQNYIKNNMFSIHCNNFILQILKYGFTN